MRPGPRENQINILYPKECPIGLEIDPLEPWIMQVKTVRVHNRKKYLLPNYKVVAHFLIDGQFFSTDSFWGQYYCAIASTIAAWGGGPLKFGTLSNLTASLWGVGGWILERVWFREGQIRKLWIYGGPLLGLQKIGELMPTNLNTQIWHEVMLCGKWPDV